jgi:hypothetical protein
VKSDAYKHADEGHYSPEIDTLHKIDRFGLEAITGRKQFFYGELRRMIYAENIITAYKSRAQSNDWAKWIKDNPTAAEMLAEAEMIAEGLNG